jgi:hypothetical protein
VDPQAAVAALAGQLRRARPGAAHRAGHLHREDGRRRWLSDERRLIERDEWTPPAQRRPTKRVRGVTVEEYATTWLAQRSLKHRTKAHYTALVANHIADSTLGSIALRNLTPAAVRSWYAALDPTHKTARSHAYAMLHGICATAVGDGLLTDNPCAIKGAMTTTRQRQPVILSVGEVAALADAIRPARRGGAAAHPRRYHRASNGFQRRAQVVAEHLVVEVTAAAGRWKQQRVGVGVRERLQVRADRIRLAGANHTRPLHRRRCALDRRCQRVVVR